MEDKDRPAFLDDIRVLGPFHPHVAAFHPGEDAIFRPAVEDGGHNSSGAARTR